MYIHTFIYNLAVTETVMGKTLLLLRLDVVQVYSISVSVILPWIDPSQALVLTLWVELQYITLIIDCVDIYTVKK